MKEVDTEHIPKCATCKYISDISYDVNDKAVHYNICTQLFTELGEEIIVQPYLDFCSFHSIYHTER